MALWACKPYLAKNNSIESARFISIIYKNLCNWHYYSVFIKIQKVTIYIEEKSLQNIAVDIHDKGPQGHV